LGIRNRFVSCYNPQEMSVDMFFADGQVFRHAEYFSRSSARPASNNLMVFWFMLICAKLCVLLRSRSAYSFIFFVKELFDFDHCTTRSDFCFFRKLFSL
jgi:hypothetical protein